MEQLPKIAVIDIGTNSFHLLIVEVDRQGNYRVLKKERIFVKLALDGIQRISDTQFDKGLQTLRTFRSIYEQYQVDDIHAFGTAAIREAANGRDFIEAVKKELGIQVYCIDGDTEATMTYTGVQRAVEMDHKPVLIMDIGGGSVEFIIGNQDKIFWQTSLPIGASILKDRFHREDPIARDHVDRLQNYLKEELHPLKKQVAHYDPDKLIGVAGSFETVADIIAANDAEFHYSHEEVALELPLDAFWDLHERLIRSNLEERLAIKGMHPERADMIVVASILTTLVIKNCGIREMVLSRHGLKEGILYNTVQGLPITSAEL